LDGGGDPSEREGAARVLGGDREGFGLRIRRYETGLLRFATRMLGSRDVAADAVAESLVRAYRHLASCRDPSRLRTWLYRIVANRCKSYLARRDVADAPLEEAPPVADVTDNEAALERAEELALVARGPPPLAPDQRGAVVLENVEGVRYQEMGDVAAEAIPA